VRCRPWRHRARDLQSQKQQHAVVIRAAVLAQRARKRQALVRADDLDRLHLQTAATKRQIALRQQSPPSGHRHGEIKKFARPCRHFLPKRDARIAKKFCTAIENPP